MLMRLAVLAFFLSSAPAHAVDAPFNLKQQVLWDHLRLAVAAEEQQLDGVLGVAILDLSSGQTLLIRPDEVFPQASSIKIGQLDTARSTRGSQDREQAGRTRGGAQ